MFHEPIFSIFMAAVAVAITLIVWNLLANVGPQTARDSVPGMRDRLQPISSKRNV
jgi:hypothetical protein